MASGYKSEMPQEIYVIFNGYEVRYYTTPESFAQALTDGYGHHSNGKPYDVKVFVPVDLADDRVAQELLNVTASKPPAHRPYNHPHPMWTSGPNYQPISLTPQQAAANAAYEKQFEKDEKARRKKHKDKILAGIRAAMGRLRP